MFSLFSFYSILTQPNNYWVIFLLFRLLSETNATKILSRIPISWAPYFSITLWEILIEKKKTIQYLIYLSNYLSLFNFEYFDESFACSFQNYYCFDFMKNKEPTSIPIKIKIRAGLKMSWIFEFVPALLQTYYSRKSITKVLAMTIRNLFSHRKSLWILFCCCCVFVFFFLICICAI